MQLSFSNFYCPYRDRQCYIEKYTKWGNKCKQYLFLKTADLVLYLTLLMVWLSRDGDMHTGLCSIWSAWLIKSSQTFYMHLIFSVPELNRLVCFWINQSPNHLSVRVLIFKPARKMIIRRLDSTVAFLLSHASCLFVLHKCRHKCIFWQIYQKNMARTINQIENTKGRNV